MDTEIGIDVGEIVSKSTKRMMTVNDYLDSDFSRRCDILLYENIYYDVKLNFVELNLSPLQLATVYQDNKKQERINATILNDEISLCNDKKEDLYGLVGKCRLFITYL